jgi:N-acetylmuramoyl-L-alanine amidase
MFTIAAALLVGSVAALPSATPPQPAPATTEVAARHAMRALRTIVIDPGHGGDNRGCLGVDGTWEKAATLDIALRVEALLAAETSVTTRLTRRDDRALALGDRSELANRWGADVFLSIHLNADPFGQGSGIETWFLAPDGTEIADGAELAEHPDHEEALEAAPAAPEAAPAPAPDEAPPARGRVETRAAAELARDADLSAARAASQVLAELVVLGMAERTGARVRGVRQARFGVLKGATMPAIVVECGFFSHADEGMRLTAAEYRETIARGIVDGLLAYDARLGLDGAAPAEAQAAR